MFPPVFVERMAELGIDISLYQKYPRKAVHILRHEEEIVNTFNLEPVLWGSHCFWADELKKIQDVYYNSVFVQDAASVVPVLALDVKNDHCVLDLCAAPGSKTLHIAHNAQYVVANDSHRNRVRRLRHNMTRFGVENCEILCCDGKQLRLNQKMDRVLVDASCTGEGLVGKIHKAMKLWSVKRIKVLSHVQRRLVVNGLSLLKRGGILVYSTCTFAPEENEGVIDYVLKKMDYVKLEQISIAHLQYVPGLIFWKGKEYDPSVKKTIRIYPFHNNTNGFFVARLRKIE